MSVSAVAEQSLQDSKAADSAKIKPQTPGAFNAEGLPLVCVPDKWKDTLVLAGVNPLLSISLLIGQFQN